MLADKTNHKQWYVSSLAIDQELDNEPFMLHDLVRRMTKDGRPYILCTLQDKTGKVDGIFWNVPEDIDSWLRPGQVILVTGRVVNYRDSPQVRATDFNLWYNPDLSDFLPSSARPRGEMLSELEAIIGSLKEPWQSLAGHILLDESFLHRFMNAPAARTMHHAYVGGLLEHSLSMAELAGALAGHYPHVDRDLLITGALLHDVGKTLEYLPEASFATSDDGRLVGHIVRAIVMVEQAAAELGSLSHDMVLQLVHLIASHHGTQEWGSPTQPKTLEAILLHQIDLLDSRVQGFFDHCQNDVSEDGWTLKPSPMFGTRLRRPVSFTVKAGLGANLVDDEEG